MTLTAFTIVVLNSLEGVPALMQCYPVGHHLKTLRPFRDVAQYFPRLLDLAMALNPIDPYAPDHCGQVAVLLYILFSGNLHCPV